MEPGEIIMANFVDKSEQTAIIEILKQHNGGPLKAAEIAKLTGHTVPTVTARLQAMAFDGRVKITRQPGKLPALWTLPQELPNAVPPRNYVAPRQAFTGVDWSASLMRPGCQDHMKHPSKRADGLHPYREPILNASSSMALASGHV
jgi:hypothetical protein